MTHQIRSIALPLVVLLIFVVQFWDGLKLFIMGALIYFVLIAYKRR